MASIINAGSGSNAELIAPYTTQASQHSLLFGIGGEADTKFPLPTGTSWVVVELYFIEADESTIAYTEWFDKLNDISARLIEIQDAIEADSLITNYKIVASHYNHIVSNKVDVYRGEHLDGQSRVDIVLDSSNVDFTFPVGNWKLSDTVLAPSAWEMLFEMDSFYTNPTTHEREIVNVGTNGSASNIILHGSNAIYMNGTDQYTRLKIPYQLGVEEFTAYLTYGGVVATENGVNDWTLVGTNANYLQIEGVTYTDRNNRVWTFTANIVSGSATYDQYDDGVGWQTLDVPVVIVNGVNTVEMPGRGDGNNYLFLRNSTTSQTFEIDSTFTSIKEVNNVNSFITRHNVSDNTVTTLDMVTTHSTTYKQETSFNNWFATNVVVTAEDRTYIKAHPEALVNMWFGADYTGVLSFDKTDMQGIYIGNEGELGVVERVYDITDQTWATYAEVINFTEACRNDPTVLNTDYGVSNFLLKQDASGRVIGMADAGTIVGANDGRYLKLPLVTPQDKTILKDVDKIEGDDTLLTIYYTDETTEEIT